MAVEYSFNNQVTKFFKLTTVIEFGLLIMNTQIGKDSVACGICKLFFIICILSLYTFQLEVKQRVQLVLVYHLCLIQIMLRKTLLLIIFFHLITLN
jgi:hypothetical protein